jgi:hypothetical protein
MQHMLKGVLSAAACAIFEQQDRCAHEAPANSQQQHARAGLLRAMQLIAAHIHIAQGHR